MKNLVIASLRKDAGKTSFIVGVAGASEKRFGYLKPFGDRLPYRKKRLWDYDAAVCTTLFSRMPPRTPRSRAIDITAAGMEAETVRPAKRPR